jgi:hypothetical protein
MIRLTQTRTVRTGSARGFADARVEFQQSGCLKLAGFLDGGLLEQLQAAVEAADFYQRVHDGIGVELCAAPGALTSALEFMTNDPVLFHLIDEITGCGSIGCFEPRVYRLSPRSGHYDSWHDDVGGDRVVAMSINLGREPFEGGLLQIRRADSPALVREVSNPTPGDAVIFRIDPVYCHRVGPVTGSVPRTACAGWFRSQPDFRTLLADKLASAPV